MGLPVTLPVMLTSALTRQLSAGGDAKVLFRLVIIVSRFADVRIRRGRLEIEAREHKVEFQRMRSFKSRRIETQGLRIERSTAYCRHMTTSQIDVPFCGQVRWLL